MKHRAFLFFFWLALAGSLEAQGTVNFSINFPGVPPPQTNIPPNGTARLSSGRFSVSIYLGSTRPTYAWIEELAQDGSLTPIHQLASLDAVNPPGTLLMLYSYVDNWAISPAQAQNLLGGLWYAEIDYGSQTHLGQIVTVPEPSAVSLILFCTLLPGFSALRPKRQCQSGHRRDQSC